MEKRLIKKTNDRVSSLGFGAMRLPLKNGKIDRELGKAMIYHAIDNGINVIDTAAMYGNGDSEKFLGEILTDEMRENLIISTKLPVYLINKEEEFEKTLNKQLDRLNCETIDYYYLHSIDLKTLRKMESLNIYNFLEKAKKEGKIKYVGFSYHGTKEKFKEVVDSYNWDVVMVQYNYLDENVQASKEGIEYAASKDMGVFVMEPLKGGLLAGKMPEEVETVFKEKNHTRSNADWAFSWILNNKNISCVLSGMRSIEEVDENIAIVSKTKSNGLNLEDLETINLAKEAMQEKLKINCTTCGYCMPCPEGVNIPESIKLYNEKYLFNSKKLISQAFINYLTVTGGIMNEAAYAGLCNKCGKCIRKCPQHLNIPKELKKVQKEFEIPGFKIFLKFVKHVGIPLFQLIGM